jgi:hydrogenase maturation protein HypF
MHISLHGVVQGVGFRPFVYRLASELNLPGWVMNSLEGVFIEVEGKQEILESFLLRIQQEKPALSYIQSLEFSYLDPASFTHFEIRESDSTGVISAFILPDIATCQTCLAEVFDPENRRYHYPFTNCTNCGPRYTIIEALPYDRPNTSMKTFRMCPDCREEYENPKDRRFHAQPNACPVCGPQLELWDASGRIISNREDAILEAAREINKGKIIAIKGLGGFHLVVDAGNQKAVETLRLRKHREEKPFALMYPSLEHINNDCRVSHLEARLLCSTESPIVLLERKQAVNSSIALAVAPHNPYLGIMLPYTPLHHLLMKELDTPVIATSGNLSDEPICIEEQEALKRLSGIADLFLVHNRPIVRHVDDSIVRIVLGRELVLRRSRGYAPLPVRCKGLVPGILAVGGHLKNTIAVSVEKNIFISQHIGDLENNEAAEAFQRVIESFRSLYRIDPILVATDLHPDYQSTKFARTLGIPVVTVQHHYAHVAACMAENELDGSVLGVSWDGTGYGLDDTVWGGEFLLTDEKSFTRVASFRKFRLPGSGMAVKEPRRTALGLLYEIYGAKLFEQKDLASVRAFSEQDLTVLSQMLQKGINSPWTTSAGRLFDAVASISGHRQLINFEGQAAMELEFLINQEENPESYPMTVSDQTGSDETGTQTQLVVDWEPMIRAVIDDVRCGIPLAKISRKFHNSMVEAIVQVAKHIKEKRVVLTGGCFQNKFLLEQAVHRLEAEGFRPYWHQRIPPNDGGIALGQIVAISRK